MMFRIRLFKLTKIVIPDIQTSGILTLINNKNVRRFFKENTLNK